MNQLVMDIPDPVPAAPVEVAPRPMPRHACLRTFSAIAAAIGPERLVSASMRWRRGLRPAGPFAVGVGGGRAVVRAMGVTGRGERWEDAAMDWLQRAAE